MRKKSGVGSGVCGVGGVCNQRDSFSVAMQKRIIRMYPQLTLILSGAPSGVTYGSMQIVIYKNTEDETSHALGLVVPPVGTTSPNGWDNNRFGRELYLALRRHNVTSVSTYTKTGVRLSIGVG